MAYLQLPSFWEGCRSISYLQLSPFLLGLLFLLEVTRRTRRWYRLCHIPGPWICGWTGLWVAWQNKRGRFPAALKEVSDKYGPVIRIGPHEIITTDVEALHRISGVKHGWRKNEWYIIGKMGDANSIFVLQDPEERKERKKKIAPAYAGKGTDSFEEGMDRGVARWIDSIEQRYAGKMIPMDLARHAHYGALDILGEVAYSQDLGFLKNNKDMGDFLKINNEMIPLIAMFGGYTSFFQALNKWPLSNLLPKAGDRVGVGAVMTSVTALIDERLNTGAKPKRDILQSFIAHGLNRSELLVEVTLQFFAGTDTTASIITLILLYLMTTPTAYRKLQSELDATHLSTPIRDSEARALPYLQACIRETLRLMPALASAPFYKDVPAEGDEIAGYHLPRGTRVGTNAAMYAVGREKAFWGPTADLFMPERWLEADNAQRAHMQARVDLVFGDGQFVCMGKAIALMEIGKAVPELLRRYDISLADPTNGPTVVSAVAWMVHGLWVIVEKRETEV